MGKISQSYVSKELMHFVGRKKQQKETRYKILIDVLNKGILTPVPEYPETSGLNIIRPDRKLSSNEVYSPDIICFCDIPAEDIGIHMRKYSMFGLSFLKPYLVLKGANPVFYIEKDSNVKLPKLFQYGKQHLSRAEYFDDIHKVFRQVMGDTEQLMNDHPNPTERIRILKQHSRFKHFLQNHIFSFLKFYNSHLDDNHRDNFYMEREWRVFGNVEFKLDDVYRVVLPKVYIERFRKDVPNYNGQIMFADF